MNTDEINYHFYDAISQCDSPKIRGILPNIKSHIRSEEWTLTKNLAEFDGPIVNPTQHWRFLACMLIYNHSKDMILEIISEQFPNITVNISYNEAAPSHCVDIYFYAGGLDISFYGVNPFETPWFVCSRFVDMLPLLVFCGFSRKISKKFRFNMHDCGINSEVTFCSNYSSAILVPDICFIGSLAYSAEKQSFKRKSISWHQKKPTAFWRGATTGNMSGGWRSIPRVKLCELARDDADDRFDCGITGQLASITDAEFAEMSAEGLIKSTVASSDFDYYRYHIDIDGNSNSWPGLFIKLLTGSPVLKVASPAGYRQWYYDKLTPWENFVPVESDLSDLKDKLDWLVKNDREAQLIGHAGRALAESLSVHNQSELTCARFENSASPEGWAGPPA